MIKSYVWLLILCVPGMLKAQEIALPEYQKINEMALYENAVINQLAQQYILKKRIEVHADYLIKNGEFIKIAILGQSSDELSQSGFNGEILKDLFQLIKYDHPSAVFFNGNLVDSLHIDHKAEKEDLLALPEYKNIFGEVEDFETGVYKSEIYQSNLNEFKKYVIDYFGEEIPFYPLAGVQESLGANSVEILTDSFSLKNANVLDSNQLVYTVSLGNVSFIIVSTNYFQKDKNSPKLHSLSEPFWPWFQTTLKQAKQIHPYVFVIGSDPAYSTSATFNVFQGLDQNKRDRNRFWKLLMDHKINAYFCGGEILYDRTYRYGIWQIITGGAGTQNNLKDTIDDTFYHYVLLSIPKKATESPVIQVFDNEGVEKDRVILKKEIPAIFDFRISKKP